MQCQRRLQISRVTNISSVLKQSGVAFRLAQPYGGWASLSIRLNAMLQDLPKLVTCRSFASVFFTTNAAYSRSKCQSHALLYMCGCGWSLRRVKRRDRRNCVPLAAVLTTTVYCASWVVRCNGRGKRECHLPIQLQIAGSTSFAITQKCHHFRCKTFLKLELTRTAYKFGTKAADVPDHFEPANII